MKWILRRGVQSIELVNRFERFKRTYGSTMTAPPAPREEQSDSGAVAGPDPTRTWVKFKVVDDATGDPVENVQLKITLPSGSEQTQSTNAEGLIDIRGVPEGVCTVGCAVDGARIESSRHYGKRTGSAPAAGGGEASPGSGGTASPIRVLLIDEHKVKAGEGLSSLAEGVGLTWQALAEFNWGTSAPAEINEHLRDVVGCTRQTADGDNYVFDDSDDPGIVYLPRPFQKDGLQTTKIHELRVTALTPARTVRIYMDVFDAEEALDDEYHLTGAEGKYDRTLKFADAMKMEEKRVLLRFTGVVPEGTYTLEHKLDADTTLTVFENVPWESFEDHGTDTEAPESQDQEWEEEETRATLESGDEDMDYQDIDDFDDDDWYEPDPHDDEAELVA